MSQQELLKLVTQTLERVGIEYMVTGSVASGLQGEPRSTHDIDLVVSLHMEQIDSLVRAFPPPEY
jgi:predicted nucleotidyltransferase